MTQILMHLWLYDAYEDKFVEKIYENPDYDVGGIVISEKTEKPVYVSMVKNLKKYG